MPDMKSPAASLVVLSGLPGTGKTTLGKMLSRQFGCFYLRADSVEAPFLSGLPAGSQSVGGKGYEALINVARENLQLGHSVILDLVNPLHLTRAWMTSLAGQTKSELIQFELVMQDKETHRRRVESRQLDIPNQEIPSWQDVQAREYEKWDESEDGPRTILKMDDFQSAARRAEAVLAGKIPRRFEKSI